MFSNNAMNKYIEYKRKQEILLNQDKIEETDIMTWDEYLDGYIDNAEESEVI